MNHTIAALTVLLLAALPARGATITVLVPATGEKAYPIAGEAFVNLWEKVTSQRPLLKTCPATADKSLPAGDLAVIGSDAVQPLLHRLILDGRSRRWASPMAATATASSRFRIKAGGC